MNTATIKNPVNQNIKKLKWAKTVSKMKKYKVLYIFLTPGILLLILFSYIPMIGLTMVFQNYDPISGFLRSTWCGLDNFRILFNSPSFASSMKNTLIISSLKLIITFPLPIIFALLLNELRTLKFKKTVQTITYLPHFTSWVIVAGIWYKMLSPNDGIINQLLLTLNIVEEPIYFMQSEFWFYVVLIFTEIWKSVAYGSIYFLASISSIDVEQYEAAVIDGAGRFKQAIYITLPGMKPTIVLMSIFAVSSLLDAGFNQLWTMGNLSVRNVAEILDTAVLRTLTSGSIQDLSIGAAMGFFKSIVGAILFLGANLLARAIKQESIV